MSDYRLSEIHIVDLFGTKAFDLHPKLFTEVYGSNGRGKTSIRRAVNTIFDGGSDPAWIRKGAKRGQITLVLNTGHRVVKTITPKSYTLEAFGPDGKPIPSPKEFVASLGDSWAVDPGKLLDIDSTTKPGRRQLTEELLKLLDLSFRVEDLEAVCTLPKQGDEQPKVDYETLAAARRAFPDGTVLNLDGINKLRKQVEADRRDIGVAATEAEKSVSGLQSTLPPPTDSATDWTARLLVLQARDTEIRETLRDYEGQANTRRVEEKAANNNSFEAAKVRLEAEARAKIDAINKKLASDIEEYSKRRDEAVREVEEVIAKTLKDASVELRADLEAVAADIATAKAKADAQVRAGAIREQIESFRKRAEVKNSDYKQLSKLLAVIDAAKKAKLDKLPVPGMSVEGDQPYIDGVEWQFVNEQTLTDAAIAICAQRKGALPFMILDRVEHYDGNHFEALKASAIAAGFQVMAVRVATGPKILDSEGNWTGEYEDVPLSVQTIDTVGPQVDGTFAVEAR